MIVEVHAVPRIGDRTKNGAVIIDINPAWDSSGYVALCLWVEDTQLEVPTRRTVDPYVTWFVRSEQGKIVCTQGHYFDQLSAALVDFDSRI